MVVPASRGYGVVGGVDRVIPVDLYVPGCPARPEAILHGVAQLLELAQKKVAPARESQVTARELASVGHVPEPVPGGDGPRAETPPPAPALHPPGESPER